MYPSQMNEDKAFDNLVPTTISKPGTLWGTVWDYMAGDEIREPASPPGPFAADVRLAEPPAAEGLAVCWIGHSTVVIDIDGKRFLTDPIWSRRCSPFSLIGPRRFFDPPAPLNQVRYVDGVIISHDHYDHLDEATIRCLGQRDVIFYVPRGVGKQLRDWGISEKRIRERTWWEEIRIGLNHRLIATPARHFSGRGIFDRNRTLWVSWVIQGSRHRVFFGGDGGYFPGFDTIGRLYGPFDLTMLEIGAYHPNWGEIHLGPRNAVKAHRKLRGRVLLPIHWGTFKLALHAWNTPAEEVIEVAKKDGVQLLLPLPGKMIAPMGETLISRWWEAEDDRQRIAAADLDSLSYAD
ncbi:MAG: MBL fold metallo-hydrolase [Thermodesulfobacteriota bacterium]